MELPPVSAILPFIEPHVPAYGLKTSLFYVVAGLYEASGNMICKWEENGPNSPREFSKLYKLQPWTIDSCRPFMIPGHDIEKLAKDFWEQLELTDYILNLESLTEDFDKFPCSNFDLKWVIYVSNFLMQSDEEERKKLHHTTGLKINFNRSLKHTGCSCNDIIWGI